MFFVILLGIPAATQKSIYLILAMGWLGHVLLALHRQVQYVAQYPAGTSIWPLKTKTQFAAAFLALGKQSILNGSS